MYKSIKELNLIGWLTIVVLILLSQTNLLAAGTGDLKGIIVDATTGDGLPGANVYLENTAIGGATDLDGFYHIMSIPAGSYDLVITYIGYTEQTISIQVSEDQTLEQHVEMTPSFVEIGETINVSAQRVGQQGAINQQLTSDALMNVVSSDRIQELPDANVAESVGRIPGVSVTRDAGEANKIVIRGLEPKFNAITVNGVRIPSTDSGNRSVDLSMISSESLEAIEVFKAATPDMDAEAIGGIVNLRVKKAPQERTMRLKLNGGYNHLNDDYSNYKLISEFGQRFFDQKLGLIVGGNFEKINRGSERYGGTWDTEGNGVEVPITTVGEKSNITHTQEIRNRLGINLTLDYAYDDGNIWITNFFSKTSRDPYSVKKNYNPEADNIVYEVESKNIDLAALSSSINGEHTFSAMKMDWIISRYTAQTDNDQDYRMEFREQGDPYDDDILDDDDPDTYPLAARNDLNTIYLRNAYSKPDKTLQTDYSANLNFKIPFNLGKSLGGFLKFGSKYTQTKRKRENISRGQAFYYLRSDYVGDASADHPRPLIFVNNGQIAARNFIKSETDYNLIVNNEYKMFPLFKRSKIDEWFNYQQSHFNFDRSTLSDEYDLKESVMAGYIMAKLNFGQTVSVIPGVRYEGSDNTYNGVWSTIGGSYGGEGVDKDSTSTRNYEHWFPHLHIKYKPLSWFDLRLSVNKTLARPNYNWVSPWTKIKSSGPSIKRGNPDLKDTKSWNYDVTTSFYSNTFGFFTLGGFYKEFEDVFYEKQSRVLDDDVQKYSIPGGGLGYEMTSYANSDKAKLWGIEVDLQTQFVLFPFIPDFLKGIVLNANYTRVWSEMVYPFYRYRKYVDWTAPGTPTITEYDETERIGTMPGQAKQLFNISMGYDTGNFSSRISILFQDESRDKVKKIYQEDEWDDNFWRWDASVKYKITQAISVDLNLVNISGTQDVEYFGSTDYLTDRFYYGMTGSAGIQYYFNE